ncbi:hypothetical protein [Nocardia africana]|uniref:Uncharacterized protein n=1 Tax=Nocardia africana TaxID=134964 RepID=A0A378WNP2_9NOCA|nr:hypothetical protein [Nocardia africana]MCC3314779.1 hypothetical protein [Nocardia africana]SUA42940.1 Uncharacterised protein [Nocardia africana]
MQSTPSTVEVSDIDAECLRDLVTDEISAHMSVQPDVAAGDADGVLVSTRQDF